MRGDGVGELDSAPAALMYGTAVPHSVITSSTPLPGGKERGAHSIVSFAIEPIQLPIVPLSLFSAPKLHTTAARKHAAPTGPPIAQPLRRAVLRTRARGP